MRQQFLVTFTSALDQDGYLKEDHLSKPDPHYYRIDTRVANTEYTETNQRGEPLSVKDVHTSNGLVGIYSQIAKSITSSTTVLVNYAHENIAFPELLGIEFKNKAKDGEVASLKGDFLFASSSAFASGNRDDNFAFGLATLRFDLTT